MTTDTDLKWRPIETAPRDGTRVLIWDGSVWVAWYDDAKGLTRRWISDEWDHDPTHWMPLPQPPEEKP